jgi:peroxiredoxin
MSRRSGVRATLAIALGLLGAAAFALEASLDESRHLGAIWSKGDSCEGVLRVAAPKHYVTPSQLAASNAMVQRVVDDFAITTADGRRLDWPALSGGEAVLVVFIKNGCPCSVEFEPYFHRLFEAYRDTTRFIGVIDGDPSTARRYAETHSVPYPVIADPEERLIGRFAVRNGGYAALLAPEGTVVGFWPGFSQTAMSDLGRRISLLARVAERPIDTAGLPRNLTTGCPFAGHSEGREVVVTSN